MVVVAYGAPDLLEACLGALGGTLPLVVVDNSSDPSVRTVAVSHGARYLDPGRNLGFAGGVNVGLDQGHVSGHDVLLLNPDAQITPREVTRLHRCLTARTDLACVAPAQFDEAGGRPARVGWPFPTPAGAWIEAMGLGRLRRTEDFVIGIRADVALGRHRCGRPVRRAILPVRRRDRLATAGPRPRLGRRRLPGGHRGPRGRGHRR